MSQVIHTVTVSSPYLHSARSEDYGANPFYQRHLAEQTFLTLIEDPYDQGMDLRQGHIRVTVHKDGLHATAEVVADA